MTEGVSSVSAQNVPTTKDANGVHLINATDLSPIEWGTRVACVQCAQGKEGIETRKKDADAADGIAATQSRKASATQRSKNSEEERERERASFTSDSEARKEGRKGKDGRDRSTE